VTLFTRIIGVFKSMDRMVGLFEKGLAKLRAAVEAA
jgi:hypothetical protein